MTLAIGSTTIDYTLESMQRKPRITEISLSFVAIDKLVDNCLQSLPILVLDHHLLQANADFLSCVPCK